MNNHLDLCNALRVGVDESLGCEAAEVWLYNNENGMIEPMEWYSENNGLEQPTKAVAPGECLSGILWSEASSTPHKEEKKQEHFSSRNLLHFRRFHVHHSSVQLRDIQSLIEDPDTSICKRLNKACEENLSLAIGVVFESTGVEGVVIFYIKNEISREKISSPDNLEYVSCIAHYIGSIVSLNVAQKAGLNLRQSAAETNDEDATTDLEMPITKAVPQVTPPERKQVEASKMPPTSANSHYSSISAMLHKWKGGTMQAPPAMDFYESCFTLIGVFLHLLVLSSLNEAFKSTSWGSHSFIFAPFAGLAGLQYGLTKAPAAQPQTIILSQLLSGLISIPIVYYGEHVIPFWLRLAIVPSLVIGAMAKLGIIHPPAAAQAALYATGSFQNFCTLAMVLMACTVSFVPAVIINNLNKKRQYPSYWISVPIFRTIGLSMKKFGKQ